MKHRLKILFVISNPNIGGSETLLLEMSPYLERIGCGIDIVNTWCNSAMKGPALGSNLSYQELSSRSRYIRFRDLTKLIHFIRDGKYDIVQGFGIRVTLLLRLARPFFKNTPFVIPLHGMELWRKWHNALAHVPLFMQKSGLSYKELLQLIDTTFINPTKTIKIQFNHGGADTCDLEKATITELTDTVLDKMHRFSRLWRKLDLDIPEFDKAINTLKISDVNDNLLLQLSHLIRLCKKDGSIINKKN